MRKFIATIALVAAGATAPAIADDGDRQQARVLLENARSFGKADVRGTAAGEIKAEREARRNARQVQTESERRWAQIQKTASYGQ